MPWQRQHMRLVSMTTSAKLMVGPDKGTLETTLIEETAAKMPLWHGPVMPLGMSILDPHNRQGRPYNLGRTPVPEALHRWTPELPVPPDTVIVPIWRKSIKTLNHNVTNTQFCQLKRQHKKILSRHIYIPVDVNLFPGPFGKHRIVCVFL